jgi:hypothetical protein
MKRGRQQISIYIPKMLSTHWVPGQVGSGSRNMEAQAQASLLMVSVYLLFKKKPSCVLTSIS